MAEEHSHGDEEVIREEVPIFYRSGNVDLPGYLVKVGGSYFFETIDHSHVRVHLWRIRGGNQENGTG